MALFDRSHKSYSHFIVTMALSCIVSAIKQDIGRKSRFFIYPRAFDDPAGTPLEFQYTIS